MNHPGARLRRAQPSRCRVSNINASPLMGKDKGQGEQTFYHPHLPSPIKGQELYGNPVAPLIRDFRKAPTSYRELSS